MKPLSHHLCIIALATGLALLFFAYPAPAQLLPSSPLDDMIGRPIGDPLLEDRLDGAVAPLDEALTEAEDEARGAVEKTTAAVPTAAQQVAATALGSLRPFVAGVDPLGHAIEEDVLMMLIEPAALSRLRQSGWAVTDARPLPSLGFVLVRITGPAARSLAEAAGNLRAEFPDAAVDYNFLYRLADAAGAASEGGDSVASEPGSPGAHVRIGLIDSAVAARHPALADVNVIRRDFAPHEGERPLGHGTAVASILAANSGDDAEILAASVFFRKPGFAPGATTESLVAALDWLAGSDVDVINMSLAGPADALLERALASIAADGPVVVAAVGNNGPAGEPLYPAAYESVVGVTAVDRERRIFPYANRGQQVAFAAPGVNVKVANSLGGFRFESGTSMASPHVAAVIAAALYGSGLPKEALLESLKATAVDLGDEGFDPVFGYGLVQPQRNQNAAASLAE
ncbi:MAG TPA: S8 family serine peptidase [Woeseiaceae bacterium]|nr:S8 family serine peptidase [Woeseiaceae bacterium]